MGRKKKTDEFDSISRLERAIEATTKAIEEPVAGGEALAAAVHALNGLVTTYSTMKRLPNQKTVDDLSRQVSNLQTKIDAISLAFEKHKAASVSGLATRLNR